VGTAQTPPPDLFTPLAVDRIAAPTAEQNRRIEQIRSLATTESVNLIQINLGALKGNQLHIAIPGLAAFDLSKTGGDSRADREFTWSGAATGTQTANATVVVRNGEVTGSITNLTGLYRILPVGNGVHALVKVDTTKLPPEEPPSFRQKEQQKGALPQVPKARLKMHDTSITQVDVLVAYTPAAKASVPDIDATIALAVAETNQSYKNSNIYMRLNLVDSMELQYSEAGKSFDQILADFAANPTVNQHRDQAAADLSAMIIDQSDYCGLADAIMATASTAFAVVYYDCATGYYSFGHELGHLMGARHNEQMDPTNTPFAYGHGFQHRTPPPTWRTIMAYVNDCGGTCPRLQYWSNPNVNYNGYPMGTTSTNDNARVLNGTRGSVAAFRVPTGPQFPVWGVVSSAGKQSGTPNWGTDFNPTQKWYEINIQAENYYFESAATLITPTFPSNVTGYCNSGSVSGKLLVECFDGAGKPAEPVSFAFASFKQPSAGYTYQGALAFGVVSKSGKKESGSTNFTSTYNSAEKQFEISISGENYFYLNDATVVTPSFATGAEGFCTTNSVNNKLIVKCYDCSGNVVVPVSFGFATLKGPGAYAKPLAFGVVASNGTKQSGTANFTSTFNPASNWYEVAITGQNYFYLTYATAITPSFATGASGFCTSESVNNKLIVQCYDHTGTPVKPVSFGFATFK
jgi:hypothetical protein